MKTQITLLLIALFFSAGNLQASSSHTNRDSSIYYPAAISGEAFLGGYAASIYPQIFVRAGARYEFRRKSYTGFATGLHFMFADNPGVALPLLLMGSFNEGIVSLKFDAGVTAQYGAGQPALFPTWAFKFRIGPKRKGVFLDLIYYGHFFYAYDCPRSNYTCNGGFYRVGWRAQHAFGMGVGFR